MPHIVYAVTAPETAVAFLQGQLKFMRDAGWQVSLVCTADERLESFSHSGIHVESVPMVREPALNRDLISLLQMNRAIKRLRPDIISYGTPKAALLASIASRWQSIPLRVYMLRGLRAEGLSGRGRRLAIQLERLVSKLSSHVVCVSQSLLEAAVHCGAIESSKAEIVGRGGSNGVDCDRFAPGQESRQAGLKLKEASGIPKDALVIGFVGRMVIDKGVRELVDAFRELATERPDVYLMLVGSREKVNDLPEAYWAQIDAHPRIVWLGSTSQTQVAYSAMDIMVLPSYREGLPNVVLEAGAMEIPCVVAEVTGAADAIVNEVTGLYCEARSAPSLLGALKRYLSDKALRLKHGAAAREHIVEHYSNAVVWAGYERRYRELVNANSGSSDLLESNTANTKHC